MLAHSHPVSLPPDGSSPPWLVVPGGQATHFPFETCWFVPQIPAAETCWFVAQIFAELTDQKSQVESPSEGWSPAAFVLPGGQATHAPPQTW